MYSEIFSDIDLSPAESQVFHSLEKTLCCHLKDHVNAVLLHGIEMTANLQAALE
jgi:hypothetical protein